MTDTSNQKPPNDMLADEICEDLTEAGLIPDDRRDDLESKLKGEGATQDDWNLWVDMATAPERSEEDENE